MNFKSFLPKINLPFFSKLKDSQAFFGLEVSSDKVSAALWLIRGKQMQIINTASSKYSSHEELIEAANQALDECLADFPLNPDKVLFGVPDFWLIDDNLKPEYLKLLRKMTHELDLEPMAFVSISHAISHFLQKQTGVPTTAILINYSDPLVVSIVKSGKVLGSRETKRTEDLALDMEKVLLSFDEVEVLPSRILVFGQERGSGLKEKLVAFPWMLKLPFLHLPKIDLLDEGAAIQAVCFAGASEINPDVVYHPQSQQAIKKAAESLLNHNEDLGHARSKEEQSALAAAGFVAGDIEDFEGSVRSGFEEDDDVMIGDVTRQPVPRQNMDQSISGQRAVALTGLAKYLAMPRQFLDRLMQGSDQGQGLIWKQKILIFLPILLLVGIIGAYIFFVKTTVSVFIDARVLEKDAQVIADPSITVVDDAARKIPGKIIQTSISDSGKGSSTGTKQIGDPAKGRVIIYNKTESSKSLSSGTVLTSSNGLKFKLDSSIQIASQSAQPGPNFQTIITPGKSDSVGGTASAIGPEGNLPAGTNLSVAGFSDSQMVAQVDTAFSGGTSKNINVVTADDQKRLLAQVASQTRSKAREQLQQKLTGDLKILEEGLQEKIAGQTFSKKVGDQANEFSLNLDINYTGTAYSDNDLKTMVAKSIETTVPEGYTLDLGGSETQAAATSVDKDGKLLFNAKFKAKLVPKLDLNKLKNDIKGKSPAEAADVLRKIENVVGTQFEFKPKLPTLLQRIPLLSKNITLEVTAK